MNAFILIIDDSLIVRKILETFLEREGYEVKSFVDGEAEIQAKLDELSTLSALYDSIRVVDAATWKKREEVGQQYLAVSDWLWAQGILPQYDHECKRYFGKRFSAEKSEAAT